MEMVPSEENQLVAKEVRLSLTNSYRFWQQLPLVAFLELLLRTDRNNKRNKGEL